MIKDETIKEGKVRKRTVSDLEEGWSVSLAYVKKDKKNIEADTKTHDTDFEVLFNFQGQLMTLSGKEIRLPTEKEAINNINFQKLLDEIDAIALDKKTLFVLAAIALNSRGSVKRDPIQIDHDLGQKVAHAYTQISSGTLQADNLDTEEDFLTIGAAFALAYTNYIPSQEPDPGQPYTFYHDSVAMLGINAARDLRQQ